MQVHNSTVLIFTMIIIPVNVCALYLVALVDYILYSFP